MRLRAFLIIGFLFLTVQLDALSTSGVCTTPSCVRAASKVYKYINTTVDPCENFYEFACGTFLKNAHGNEELQFRMQLETQVKQEKIELYMENINENDHKLIKLFKRLYTGCLNKPEIEDNVETFKKVFEQVGGWPVLEGSKWNETNFSWVNTTYKLRELGYHSDIFINLKSTYIFEERRHLLEISDGDVMFENLEAMTEMVMKFDPENKGNVINELEGAYKLSKTIQQLWRKTSHNREVLTLEQLQERVPLVNWIEYINHDTSLVVQFTKDDEVSFFTDYLQPLVDLIVSTPKRDLANLMMWEVVKDLIPYFDQSDVNSHIRSYVCQDRAEFCVDTIEKRLYSPMEVVYNRKYLYSEKKRKIEEMVTNIKAAAIEIISDAESLSTEGKKEVLEKLNALKIQIGLPGDYFDDKIFDYLDAGLIDAEDETFFGLLAKAKINHKAMKYSLLKKPDDNLTTLYFKLIKDGEIYDSENSIYIPAYTTRDMVYNENTPEFINYGIMGMAIGSHANDILFMGGLKKYLKTTEEFINKKRQCVHQSWQETNFNEPDSNEALAVNIAQQLAYEAYQKYVKTNGEEQKLITVDYTPNQLFWISLATIYCDPISPSEKLFYIKFKKDPYIASVYELNDPLSWNHKFVEDFKCPESSKMNSAKKCKLF